MRRLALCAAAAILAGCGGVSKQELDAVKAEMLANDEQKAAALRQELSGVKDDYVKVQKIEQEVIARLAEMKKLQEQLTQLSQELQVRSERAATSSLKVLEFEEKLLSDRLAELRRLIQELKSR